MKWLLPLFVILIENSSNYFSACQSVRGVFFFPYVSQYVGVIFNHNTWPFIASSSVPQWGLTLTELLCPYFRGSIRKDRSIGKKLSIPSISRIPAATREHHQQTYWQVQTVLSSVPLLSVIIFIQYNRLLVRLKQTQNETILTQYTKLKR